MDNLGAEVGQKMRSAIKAKLTELDCYVDDELPDYVMVMVANKRTKSQMNEDLQLFLAKKTSIFVDWLHIVLKKLKEVTVTNPEVYKKVAKRKSTELIADIKFKKEKIYKKEKGAYVETDQPSLTDDLPININKNSDKRKVVFESDEGHDRNIDDDNFDIPLLSEVNISNEEELAKIERKISIARRLGMVVDDDELTNSEDLVENQNLTKASISDNTEGEVDPSFEKISFPTKTPKNKISVHDRISANESTSKSDSSKSNLELEENKSSPEERIPTSSIRTVREKIMFDNVPKSDEYEKEESSPKENLHKEKSSETKRLVSDRITFNSEEVRPKKRSILERLGRRLSTDSTESKKHKSSVENERDFYSRSRLKDKKETESSSRQSEKYSRNRKVEERGKLRPGIQSKVSLPPKEEKIKDVPSCIKITPRKIPPDAQPNKYLLLKAVAEAQKSVTQSQPVRNNKHNGLFTETYRKNQMKIEDEANQQFSQLKKYKMKNIVVKVSRDQVSSSSEDEKPYIPKSVNKSQIKMSYTPTSKVDSPFSDKKILIKEHISVTLTSADADDSNIKNKELSNQPSNPAVSTKRAFSPIVFDDITSQVKTRVNVPDVKSRLNVPDSLTAVKLSPLLKNKERCKFWPNCRQGDKCEFTHPAANCELFPNCKFGDKCLYLHPVCKFSTSCTRRDCPYIHSSTEKNIDSTTSNLRKPSHPSNIPVCKFFPNCTKINCFFYHPRPCKYGKYCKSSDCTYLHHSKNNLTWRSNK